MKKERDLAELYQDDPQRADYEVFGRIADTNRRGFLKKAGLATLMTYLGANIPFYKNMPSGLIPAAFAEGLSDFKIAGKNGLIVLNDRPVNAQTAAHLLDDDVTPTARHFIRNNGLPPASVDASTWTLDIDGEVERPMKLSIQDLKRNFEVVSYKLQLECGGNGRGAFNPPAKGNQWTLGAVSNSEWTGVRLMDVLKAAGIKDSAVYTGHYGADSHLSGIPGKDAISRGVPIAKAMNPYSLIVFGQNGGPIHPMNGAPLRLLIPGWPGSCSQKWLNRIWVRDKVHDGTKMTGTAYRVPEYNVAPGTKVPTKDFGIINSMPVKSLITHPQTNVKLPSGTRSTFVRGHAWAGDNAVSAMMISIDFGSTWTYASLNGPPNPYSWQGWNSVVNFPTHGYYEIWAKAIDSTGKEQPFAINWNPKGYLNNSMHRIAVTIAS
ncbi:MAG: sulfite oxidase [SAR324 cluster bacterium]|nr:sulfite oxidase [SAR324 cluster bacterium]